MAFPRFVLCALMVSTVLAAIAQQNPPEFDFRKLSSWPGNARGRARDIKVMGGYACFAMAEGGFCVANVQDPANPSVLGRLDLPGIADEVEALNNLAFVACGTGGVHVISIANPTGPVRVATIASAAKVTAISTLEPNYLFVAAGQEGVSAYDISNPAAPLRVATLKLGAPSNTSDAALDVESVKFRADQNGVSSVRSLLFIAYGTAGGYVFDAADPSNMVQIAKLPVYIATVSKDNEDAYFVSGNDIYYLDLVSITSPGFPAFGKGTLQDPDRFPFPDPRFKLYSGGGFVTSKGSATPLNATYLGWAQTSLPFTARITNLVIRSAAATRDYFYLPDIFRGLEICSTVDPTFTPISALPIEGEAVHVRVSGNKVFVSDEQQGIQAFLFETNKTLRHVASYELGYTANFDVSGNYLYRLGYVGDFNVQVFDVSDPAQPRLVANLASLIPPTAGFYVFRNIAVHDGRAYVTAASLQLYPSKIYTFDVSNPESPTLLATTTGIAEEMQIVGQTLFAASSGLASYSIAADGTLNLIQRLSVSSSPSSLKVIGTTAYLCAESEGLKIYDIADPTNMQLLSTYETPASVVGVDIVGTNAFVADATGGFFVLDVSKPANPMLLARQVTDNPVEDLKVVDGFVFAANGAEGVTLWKYGPGAAQTIDFPPLADATTKTQPFTLATPVASSGLPVELTINGPATLVNGVVTITGPGVVTVRAFQAGDAIFSSATVERTFTVVEVARIPQTIAFAAIDDPSIDDDPFDISVASSSGLAVDISISGPATLDGFTVTLTGLGEVTITATQPGNPDFAPATLQRRFTVRDLAGAVAALVRSRNPSASEADTSLDADPDHDGIPNVVEFLLRTDPTSASSMEGHTTASIFERDGSQYLRARFLKPRTSLYPVGVQFADFATYPNLRWMSAPVGFDSDGTGSFLLAVANYQFPLVRFVIQYP